MDMTVFYNSSFIVFNDYVLLYAHTGKVYDDR